jgi:hypothetical protein
MPGDKVSAVTAAAIGAFLRALAERAERDGAFAQGLAVALEESGLLVGKGRRAAARTNARAAKAAAPMEVLDPFATLRGGGEVALRAALAAVEVTTLHGIVRAYRLDPARISARWTARERLVELIVTQVRARASHGQAFARV